MSESNNETTKLSEGEFMRLFVKHEAVLRAYARSILPSWGMVDDALQEASVTMWEKHGQLRNEDGFLPWAKVILRFKCLSAVAAARRDRFVLSDKVLELLADSAEEITEKEMANVRSALRNCLTHLSEAHQELVLAPYGTKGDVKQIAEQCGKSVNSLYKLLGRLRVKLGTCIQQRLQAEVA